MWTVIVSDSQGKVIGQYPWHQGTLTVGRDQGRSIVLPTKTASRKHCRLDLVNGMPVVVDEGSANGTLVNGARIGGPTRIDESSKIEVGEFRLALQREGEDEERTVMMKPRGYGTAPPQPTAPPPRPAAPPAPPPRAAPPPPPKPAAPAYPAPSFPAAPPKPATPSMPAMPSMPAASQAMGDITSQF